MKVGNLVIHKFARIIGIIIENNLMEEDDTRWEREWKPVVRVMWHNAVTSEFEDDLEDLN